MPSSPLSIPDPSTPRSPVFAAGVATYILGMIWSGAFGWQHIPLSILIWAGLSSLEGPRRFVRDWWPMVLFWLAYDGMRVFSNDLFSRVSVEAPLRWESSLFLAPGGMIWPFYFTQWAAQDGGAFSRLFSLYCNSIYISHIPTVPIVMLILWLRGDTLLFRRLVWSLTVMHILALATYLIYPAAPPWWVYENGLVKPSAEHSMPADSSGLSGLFALSPNRFAAIPSLHASYPLLLTLVLGLQGVAGRWILLAGFYGVSMWFACVYLNQHYIIDLLIGVVLVPPALAVAWRIRS